MDRRRFIIRISILFLISLALVSCGRTKDIRITSYSLASVSPRGFKAVDAVLALGIDNPAMAFTISELEGMVKNNGEPAATFTAEPVTINRKSSDTYEVPCHAALDSGITLADAIKLISSKDFSPYTVDVSFHVKTRSGISKVMKYNDLKISDIIR